MIDLWHEDNRWYEMAPYSHGSKPTHRAFSTRPESITAIRARLIEDVHPYLTATQVDSVLQVLVG